MCLSLPSPMCNLYYCSLRFETQKNRYVVFLSSKVHKATAGNPIIVLKMPVTCICLSCDVRSLFLPLDLFVWDESFLVPLMVIPPFELLAQLFLLLRLELLKVSTHFNVSQNWKVVFQKSRPEHQTQKFSVLLRSRSHRNRVILRFYRRQELNTFLFFKLSSAFSLAVKSNTFRDI